MKKIAIILTITILMFGCKNQEKAKQERINAISELKAKLIKDTATMEVSALIAKEILIEYDKFVTDYPKSKEAPEYLFEAANVSIGNQQYNLAIKYLKRIEDNYTDYSKYESTVLLQGFIYENYLFNQTLAKNTYNRFLQKFPESEMAESAKFSLLNMGKSEEEIIKEFEAKNDSIK